MAALKWVLTITTSIDLMHVSMAAWKGSSAGLGEGDNLAEVYVGILSDTVFQTKNVMTVHKLVVIVVFSNTV
jgi:hypothetical protein